VHNLYTDETRSAWDDKNARSSWVNWNWVYWDSVSRQAKICTLSGGDDDTMRAWYGYRVWTNVDDLELLLPEGGTRSGTGTLPGAGSAGLVPPLR
jgi:hypothetical protein